MSKKLFIVGSLLLTAIAVSPAMAHPGHAEGGFASGAMHPLTGIDHIVAMIAVGLWAAQIGGRAAFLLPLAFVGSLSIGALLGRAGFAFPYIEAGIAASVFVLGLMIAVSLRLPTGIAAICVGVFALFHGHAHGTEFVGDGSWLSYGVGFVLMTAALHGIGIATYLLIKAWTSQAVIKLAGGMIAAVGLALVVRL